MHEDIYCDILSDIFGNATLSIKWNLSIFLPRKILYFRSHFFSGKKVTKSAEFYSFYSINTFLSGRVNRCVLFYEKKQQVIVHSVLIGKKACYRPFSLEIKLCLILCNLLRASSNWPVGNNAILNLSEDILLNWGILT